MTRSVTRRIVGRVGKGIPGGQARTAAVAGDAEREDVAVAAPTLVEEAEGVAREADQLSPGRGPGLRGKGARR